VSGSRKITEPLGTVSRTKKRPVKTTIETGRQAVEKMFQAAEKITPLRDN
jgi:hypothetical protein